MSTEPAPTTPPPLPNRPPAGEIVWLPLIIAGVALVGYLLTHRLAGNARGSFSYHLGGAVFPVLFFWLAYFLIAKFGLGRRPHLGSLALLALVAVLTEVALFYPPSGPPAIRSSGEESPAKPAASAGARASENADRETMRAYVTEYLDSVKRMRARNDAQLIAIGLEKVLDPVRLAADKGLAQTKEICRAARECIMSQQRDVRLAADKFRDGVDQLTISNTAKRDFQRGYEESAPRVAKTRMRVNNLARESIDLVEKIATMLDAARAQWQVEDGKMVIPDSALRENYNTLVRRLREIDKENEQMVQASQEKVDSLLNKTPTPP